MIRLKENEVSTLISTPQVLTASAADLGEEIDVREVKRLFLWVDVDINQANNVRFLVLGKMAAAATAEYYIGSVGAASSGLFPVDFAEYELTTDADQKICIPIEMHKGIQYVQIQAYMGTDGGTNADIESAYLTCEK